jgi:hypothetical protein
VTSWAERDQFVNAYLSLAGFSDWFGVVTLNDVPRADLQVEATCCAAIPITLLTGLRKFRISSIRPDLFVQAVPLDRAFILNLEILKAGGSNALSVAKATGWISLRMLDVRCMTVPALVRCNRLIALSTREDWAWLAAAPCIPYANGTFDIDSSSLEDAFDSEGHGCEA